MGGFVRIRLLGILFELHDEGLGNLTIALSGAVKRTALNRVRLERGVRAHAGPVWTHR
jgi:hypothetical protein